MPSALAQKLSSLHRSPALVSAVLFALGGLGTAAGHIALARILPVHEYAAIALVLALTQLGMTLGPLGWPTLINRHGLAPSGALLARTLISSSVVGAGAAIASHAFYGLSATLSVLLALTICLAATNRVAGSLFQSREAFGASLLLTQIHNWILLASVPVLFLWGARSAAVVAAVAACGYLVSCVIGWHIGWKHRDPSAAPGFDRRLLFEGLSVVGAQLALSTLYQLDRLVIPRLLSLQDLATFAVAAAIAAAPFRMLQTGTGFSLVPRLRRCADVHAARRLIRAEALVVLSMGCLSAVAVFVVMPFITGHALRGRYELPVGLIVAMVGVGFIRLWDGFAGATATALGSSRDLALLTLGSWGAVVCALAGAGWMRDAGLVGIVCGVGAGWLVRAVTATLISVSALRHFAQRSPAVHSSARAEPIAPS